MQSMRLPGNPGAKAIVINPLSVAYASAEAEFVTRVELVNGTVVCVGVSIDEFETSWDRDLNANP